MEIILAILIMIGAFLLLIWGGDKFVDASIALAKKLKIPMAIIGATITSIGTTLPELLVTIFASTSDSSGLAVGNGLGSIIFNTAIIGGILLIFMTVSLKDCGKTSALILVFTLALLVVMSLNKVVGIWECVILLVIFVMFIILNYLQAKKEAEKIPFNVENITKPTYMYIFQFLISAAAIAVGAFLMVEKAKFLAGKAGMSELLIGLVIVSIGTSLPELITTINAIRKKEAGLGLGNIIGSCIINGTLLIACAGIISGGTAGLGVDLETLFITMPLALLITAILLIPTIFKGKTYKWQGISLICIYLVYYLYLIFSGLGIIKLF